MKRKCPYPMLALAIRLSGLRQYEVAYRVDMRPVRLSVLLRHGGASTSERERLSDFFDIAEEQLFDSDAPITVNVREEE